MFGGSDEVCGVKEDQKTEEKEDFAKEESGETKRIEKEDDAERESEKSKDEFRFFKPANGDGTECLECPPKVEGEALNL